MDELRDLVTRVPTPALVIGVFYWGFCVVASYLNYRDARQHHVGPNPQADRGFNRSLKPGEIATVVLWLGLIGLLEYLRTREERLARAAHFPCDESGIVFYSIALALFIAALPVFVIMGSF
jgi:hypothetical protein